MKDQNVILTIIHSQFEENIYNTYSKPFFEAYSKKINTELKVLRVMDIIPLNQPFPLFEIYNLLNTYKRILYIQPLSIIREDCPDLFEKIPFDKLAMMNESPYVSRIKEFIEILNYYEDKSEEKWKGMFYNPSVMLIPRQSKQLFKNPGNLHGTKIREIDVLNYRIYRDKIELHELDHRFNRNHTQDKKVGITRLASYIVSYEGAPEDMIVGVMSKDIEDWEKMKPDFEYKRNIVISVSAGMGDQIAAIPAIDHAIKYIFPKDDITIVTHHPRLFQHLNVPVAEHKNWKGQSLDSTLLYTCPTDEESAHNLSHVMFHPTDFASMSLFKKAIPPEEKTIKLDLRIDDISEIIEACGVIDLGEYCLCHFSRWWPSKTVPKWWAESVVTKLVEAGVKVMLCGKHIDAKQGYIELENIPDEVINMCDKTSLSGLIGLISQVKMVVTSDSAPLWIAGAFDPWIVTFPTAKWACNIMPFRHGVQTYKALPMWKKYVIDDLQVNYLLPDTQTVDTIPEGHTIEEYIPDVDEVVEAIKNIYFHSECKTYDEVLEKVKEESGTKENNEEFIFYEDKKD